MEACEKCEELERKLNYLSQNLYSMIHDLEIFYRSTGISNSNIEDYMIKIKTFKNDLLNNLEGIPDESYL